MTAEDFSFARRLTEWCAGQLISGIRNNFAATDHQANAKFILDIIRKAGTISRSDLLRKLDGRFKSKDLTEIIQTLLEARRISTANGKTTDKGGRPPTFYMAVAD